MISGYNAFVSFANHIKTGLAGSGINIVFEKRGQAEPPYLVLQGLSETATGDRTIVKGVQGWLAVSKKTTEPLEVSFQSELDKLLALTVDIGFLTLYDYSQDPKTDVGAYVPKLTEVTHDMSNDPLVEKRVIRWKLSMVRQS